MDREDGTPQAEGLKPLEELDNLISKELLKLNYHDRNAIIEEIHGVRCLAVEETPDLLGMSLNAFQRQIDAMSPTKKETYSEILRLKQQQQLRWRQLNQVTSEATAVFDAVPYSFIDNENFRLRFLRCEFFDAEKAAIRFVNYLNISYELFGSVALKRPVRISDLSKSEVRFARKGYMQILPYRDRAGRSVVVLLGGMSSDVDPIERAKLFFYIQDAATRDSVESQRKGVVFVSDVSVWQQEDGSGRFWSLPTFHFTPQFYRRMKQIIASVPTRIVALHACWPTPRFAIFKMLDVVAGSNCAVRIRSQTGAQMETWYKLRGYGIPIHLLPLTETGVIKTKYFCEWFRIRKTLEEATENEYVADDHVLRRVVVCPCLNDVIFRQGTPSMKNPGNVNFRDTMIAHLEDHHSQHVYLEGHQQQPDQIEIFCNVLIETTEKTKGGRFLEWYKRLNVWVRMVNRQKIKSKVAIAYRDTAKRFLSHRQQFLSNANYNNKSSNNNNDPSGDRGGGQDDEGSCAFIQGDKDGEEFCTPSKRNSTQSIDGVPLRTDSNYNETSCWF